MKDFDFSYLDRVRKVLLSQGTLGISFRELYHRTRGTKYKPADLEELLSHWHRRLWVDRFQYHNGNRNYLHYRATNLLYSEWTLFLPLIAFLLVEGPPAEIVDLAQDVSRMRTSHPEEADPVDASASLSHPPDAE